MSEAQTLPVDGRGRVSLGRLVPEGVTQFLAHQQPDGSVLLEPAQVVSAAEAGVRRDPELLARIEDAAAHPERAVKLDRAARRAARG